ncbi:hypothetical protein BABINDRAFT_175032 [Babjeviella inositovora NRRL Y-12698]|uniref:DNA-directed RNA polymerase subunit n=1 Tax=Babjeviella inositovora NRRL Y-12698 TaxID=984486 RepID=A0A1E3QU97_9ASCO|nr:uncharacterized protein BABINDRAFT_175032 [Babjeviella inositovora NRRL Y-12698]ODQ81265.1 hypothetical protein BABINDRAFT_175032 [Babjeviella inositovora NRRL Y-12698]
MTSSGLSLAKRLVLVIPEPASVIVHSNDIQYYDLLQRISPNLSTPATFVHRACAARKNIFAMPSISLALDLAVLLILIPHAMFILSNVTDLVRIPPHTFGRPVKESVTTELNKKYANKIINNLGLVVTIWDLLEVDDGLLKPGDGATFINVRFRCVVWKPFVGEVLTGWIANCTPEGIKVKLEFYDEIFIPANYLFEGCEYSPEDLAWVWRPDADTNLYLDVNEKIRFRVEEEIFANIKPKGPAGLDEEEKNVTPPYALLASCQTDGMGCVSWWE